MHDPVLLHETLELLDPRPGRTYVDCTVGGGGHAAAILERSSPDGTLIGIDLDPDALGASSRRLEAYGSRAVLVRDNFSRLPDVLKSLGVSRVDGVLFDLGVSSFQVDRAEKGFSYSVDAPLDMRYDPAGRVTAEHLVNQLPEGELASIISDYGEERWASRIARFIVAFRGYRPITRTSELVDIIKKAIPASARRRRGHPARRTFQALRIAVNDELESLRRGLDAAVSVAGPGGRICVISFHSLEDRIVKRRFRELDVEVITPRPVRPSAEEVRRNPRSRSARLRAAQVLKKTAGE